MKSKFASAYNRPHAKGETFDPKYTYSYIEEETGAKKSVTIDQSEIVNSAEYISPNELVNNGGYLGDDSGALYGDFSNLPTSHNELLAYIESLRLALEEAIKEEQLDYGGTSIDGDRAEAVKAESERIISDNTKIQGESK